jgi:hypothetical protein
MEGAEATHRPPTPPDRAVVLLDDVVEVFDAPEFTSGRQIQGRTQHLRGEMPTLDGGSLTQFI